MNRNDCEFKKFAAVPPIGWNSWDAFGASVTEQEVKQNADFIANNLMEYGWEYVVVDIQWYESTANSSIYHQFAKLEMDNNGRLIPAINRFPSAINGRGFKPLADYIHKLGLKFGIHVMRGIPRQAVHCHQMVCDGKFDAADLADNNICPWNSDMYGLNMQVEGAQEYYDSLIQLYSDWNIDFLKVDDIADSKLYGMHNLEIQAIRKAIDESGRPIILSLSPGPTNIEQADFLRDNANMWRLSDDFWDTWSQLRKMFDYACEWAPLYQVGNWLDCDIIPFGNIRMRSVDGGTNRGGCRFTNAEKRTLISLWSLVKSPRMYGGDLRYPDDDLKYLMNQQVNNMYSDIIKSSEVYRDDNIIVWQAEGDKNKYCGIFNVSEISQLIDWTQFVTNNSMHQCIELWSNSLIGRTAEIPAHDCCLIKIDY